MINCKKGNTLLPQAKTALIWQQSTRIWYLSYPYLFHEQCWCRGATCVAAPRHHKTEHTSFHPCNHLVILSLGADFSTNRERFNILRTFPKAF